MNTKHETKPSRWLLLAVAPVLLGAIFPFTCFAQGGGSAFQGAGKYTGPGSCASSACHGAITPQNVNDVLQNEYSTWIVKDKHAQSYKALTGTSVSGWREFWGWARRKRRRGAWRATR